MWSAGAHIHDKSDGAMGKHLVRCQLSCSFLPPSASSLESKPEHQTKKNRRQKWGHSISVSALEFLFFFFGRKNKITRNLLQRTLDICLGHTACARFFEDVEQRDVLFGIS